METWYRSASKYPTSRWHWRTRWSTDVTREGGVKMKRPRRQFLHLAAGAAARPAGAVAALASASRFASPHASPSGRVGLGVAFPPGAPPNPPARLFGRGLPERRGHPFTAETGGAPRGKTPPGAVAGAPAD